VRQSEAVCFYVDSEDHSFLTEHYVVTHNTITAIVSALEDNYDKILVISPASVKHTWYRELKRFMPEDDITIVEGSTWKEARFTVINYDILDNFYEIPTEIVKRKVRNVDDNGKITYKTVEKEVVSKKNAIINEAMANSQLFQSKFDLIIIDEAHKLSNANSGRYKIITDLIQRSNPKGIYELTGTMITNNPMNLYNILKIIDADITKDWQSYVKNYCDGKQIYVKGERDGFTNAFLKKKGKTSWYDLTYDEKTELNEFLDKNCKKIWLTGGASNLEELKERIKHLYLRDLNEEIYKKFKKETKVISYTLSNDEKIEYDNVWEEYINSLDEEERDLNKILDNKKLIEGSVLRQATSQMMIPHTIQLVENILKNSDDKIIIFCAFDKEIYDLKEHFQDTCVVHNGKLTTKAKEKAIDTFKNDDKCRILLGNLVSTSVGLNLIVANHVIFNSVSWLPAENQQAEYRILRIGQTKDCTIYYQKLNDTYMTRMFELLAIKNEIIDAVIVDEKNK
jgi:SNF2 family DNA or RNA helicase